MGQPGSRLASWAGKALARLICSSSTIKSQGNARHFKEEPFLYGPGGFHLVALEDKFRDGRYIILRKIGYGEYSTVWLAHDSIRNKHVALKILRADCYNGRHDIFELDILETIGRKAGVSKHPGRNHVTQLVDHFHHRGPNGRHLCLVFEVLGHHLQFQVVKFDQERFPLHIVKEIIRQLLHGLDFLHRECNVIHTDLKPTNILLVLQDSETAIADYLSNVPPRLLSEHGEEIVTFDPRATENLSTRPLREVVSTPLISESKSFRLQIIDFGVSSWIDRHLTKLIQSPLLRAPEVFIGAPWSPSVDIWSLGCLVIEFVKGHYAFPASASEKGTWTLEDDVLAQMTELLGPFPKELLGRGKKTEKFFDKDGNLLRIPYLETTTLEKLVDGDHERTQRPKDMPESEVPVFCDFLRGMLALDPEKRKSASQLLEHKWLSIDAQAD